MWVPALLLLVGLMLVALVALLIAESKGPSRSKVSGFVRTPMATSCGKKASSKTLQHMSAAYLTLKHFGG